MGIEPRQNTHWRKEPSVTPQNKPPRLALYRVRLKGGREVEIKAKDMAEAERDASATCEGAKVAWAEFVKLLR